MSAAALPALAPRRFQARRLWSAVALAVIIAGAVTALTAPEPGQSQAQPGFSRAI